MFDIKNADKDVFTFNIFFGRKRSDGVIGGNGGGTSESPWYVGNGGGVGSSSGNGTWNDENIETGSNFYQNIFIINKPRLFSVFDGHPTQKVDYEQTHILNKPRLFSVFDGHPTQKVDYEQIHILNKPRTIDIEEYEFINS